MFYQEKMWKQHIELCADGNFQGPSYSPGTNDKR